MVFSGPAAAGPASSLQFGRPSGTSPAIEMWSMGGMEAETAAVLIAAARSQTFARNASATAIRETRQAGSSAARIVATNPTANAIASTAGTIRIDAV